MLTMMKALRQLAFVHIWKQLQIRYLNIITLHSRLRTSLSVSLRVLKAQRLLCTNIMESTTTKKFKYEVRKSNWGRCAYALVSFKYFKLEGSLAEVHLQTRYTTDYIIHYSGNGNQRWEFATVLIPILAVISCNINKWFIIDYTPGLLLNRSYFKKSARE